MARGPVTSITPADERKTGRQMSPDMSCDHCHPTKGVSLRARMARVWPTMRCTASKANYTDHFQWEAPIKTSTPQAKRIDKTNTDNHLKTSRTTYCDHMSSRDARRCERMKSCGHRNPRDPMNVTVKVNVSTSWAPQPKQTESFPMKLYDVTSIWRGQQMGWAR